MSDNLIKNETQNEAAELRNRLAGTMARLGAARSAPEACQLLDLRDKQGADYTDSAIEFEVELDEMPWAVKLNFDWIEVAVLHCDGNAIIYVDDWQFIALDDLWLEHCDVHNIEDLTTEQDAALKSWMEQIKAAETAFQSDAGPGSSGIAGVIFATKRTA